MLLPTSVDILRCIERTLETVIVPTLTGVGERSAAATIGHLLRHVALRVEKEGQILVDEIDVLRPLLSQTESYLGTLSPLDAAAAQLRASTATLLGKTFAAPGYRTVASLAAEAAALRQGVCDALAFIQKPAPQPTGAAADVHQAILRYIAWEIDHLCLVFDPAFEGFGPRR